MKENQQNTQHSHHNDVCLTGEHNQPMGMDVDHKSVADEGFHADNEFMRIASFEKGQRLFAMMLHALVDQQVKQSNK